MVGTFWSHKRGRKVLFPHNGLRKLCCVHFCRYEKEESVTNIGYRLLTVVSSRLREMPSRYGPLAVALCILGLGVFVVLLVQPSPLTFTEGWSVPQGLDDVRAGHPHRAGATEPDRRTFQGLWNASVRQGTPLRRTAGRETRSCRYRSWRRARRGTGTSG